MTTESWVERRKGAAEKLAECIEREVAALPPLTIDQRARLALLLCPPSPESLRPKGPSGE